MSGWEHKDIWKRMGRNFAVEISRHSVEVLDDSHCFDSEGPHRWAVYAYIYPKHPKFLDFDAAGCMSDQPSLGMHAGLSFFKTHRGKDGAICSFQAGCDYNHLYDNEYTRMATADDASSVFADADDLVEMLRNTDVQA